MCTSVIDHTSNVYYYAVMATRTTLCLRQGRDNSKEAYYRMFEVAILTEDLEKCNTKTNMELNKAYMDGYNEDGTKRFQERCLIMSSDLD